MHDILLAEHFEPHVGKAFRFEETGFTLALDRISRPRSPIPEDAARPAFTLIFRGERAPVMPEGHYACTVEGGPSFTIYVGPIHTPDMSRQEYQATFN